MKWITRWIPRALVMELISSIHPMDAISDVDPAYQLDLMKVTYVLVSTRRLVTCTRPDALEFSGLAPKKYVWRTLNRHTPPSHLILTSRQQPSFEYEYDTDRSVAQ